MNFDLNIFSPIVDLPNEYEVFDFTQGYLKSDFSGYGVGKYLEKRPGMYLGELYKDQRDIHMGIDIAAPIGTPVRLFYDGQLFMKDFRNNYLDYGYVLIFKHSIPDVHNQIHEIFSLFGHLNKKSFDSLKVGQKVSKGNIIGWMGDLHENGNWKPHVHFQISTQEPKVCDMPGVVNEKDLVNSKMIYPDPRIILGPIY